MSAGNDERLRSALRRLSSEIEARPYERVEARTRFLERARRRRVTGYLAPAFVAACVIVAGVVIAPRLATRDGGRDRPAEQTVDRIDVGGRPSDIALAPDGEMWVTVPSGSAIVRVDPESGNVEDRIFLSSPADDLAVGAEPLWVSLPVEDTVARISTNADLTHQIRKVSVPGGGSEIELTAIGTTVWAMPGDGSAYIVRPGASEAEKWEGGEVIDVARSGDILYVLSSSGVARYEAATEQQIGDIAPIRGCDDLVFGSGYLWCAGASTFHRIDPENWEVETVELEGDAVDLTAGGGRVYVLVDEGRGARTIAAYNAADLIPVVGSPIRLQTRVLEIAVLDDQLWATLPDAGILLRVDT